MGHLVLAQFASKKCAGYILTFPIVESSFKSCTLLSVAEAAIDALVKFTMVDISKAKASARGSLS